MSNGIVVEDEGTEGAPQFNAEELASIEKGRNGLSDTPAPVAAQRPEGVPEKFWKDGAVDTEALIKSYGELEKRQGAPAETPAAETPAAVGADGKIAKPEEKQEEAPANPLNDIFDAARNDYMTSQSFSEETAEKLAAAGIPPEIQSVYIAGLSALAEKNLSTIHNYVGGAEQYSAMANWAASTLSDAELDAFNAAIDNPALSENAVRGLFARYSTARPSEGRQITPVNAGGSPGDVFGSRDELIKAQSDPRYATDPVYRAEVTDKLQRSHASGFRVSQERTFPTVYRHR